MLDIRSTEALEMAREVLGATLSDRVRTINIDDIKREVASEYGIKVSELKSRKRTKAVVLPRQIAMYIARKTTELSLPSIGGHFGGKDHSTVLHSINKIENTIKDNQNMKAMIDSIIDRLS
jgi:chromosomal replication initiator protein